MVHTRSALFCERYVNHMAKQQARGALQVSYFLAA
jgi:hypothetical protein